MGSTKIYTAVICCFIVLFFLTACGVDRQYVQADRLTYEAIAPQYIEYVNKDNDLTSIEKIRYLRTVEWWKKRIDEVEK